MKERPILFNGPMVRALLDGSKTQTRRIVKPQPGTQMENVLRFNRGQWPCPYGQPGDRLWVRETFWAYGRWETRYSNKKGRDEWHFLDMTRECGLLYGFAEELRFAEMRRLAPKGGAAPTWWKRPSIHMPRIASRITLENTGVRAERLQNISESDAQAEGIVPFGDGNGYHVEDGKHYAACAAESYASLWEAINGPGCWNANPWVWVVEFKRIESCK